MKYYTFRLQSLAKGIHYWKKRHHNFQKEIVNFLNKRCEEEKAQRMHLQYNYILWRSFSKVETTWWIIFKKLPLCMTNLLSKLSLSSLANLTFTHVNFEVYFSKALAISWGGPLIIIYVFKPFAGPFFSIRKSHVYVIKLTSISSLMKYCHT